PRTMRQCPPFDQYASPSVARSKSSRNGTATVTSAGPRSQACRNGRCTRKSSTRKGIRMRGRRSGCSRSASDKSTPWCMPQCPGREKHPAPASPAAARARPTTSAREKAERRIRRRPRSVLAPLHRQLGEVGELAAQVIAEAVGEARLQLPGPLAGEAELVADLLERHRFRAVGQGEAVLEEEAVLGIGEGLAELGQLLLEDPAQLLVAQLLLGGPGRLHDAVAVGL